MNRPKRGKKMEKKITLKKTTTIALALLGILTCSILASVLMDTFMANAAKSAYNSTYMTKSGVLSTDSYVLFPFQRKNLTIGFSKYGEMIDYDTKVGMDYNNSATDPWAPNPLYVEEYEWVEGWVINITYWHSDTFYNTWAYALYSDYSGTGGIGGNWSEGVQGGALNASVQGGRKTNGGAVTDPIKILYDGPRRFVALLKTTIYETSGHTAPLVSITFTIIFNKDKKQAIWFKDIKRLQSPKAWGDLQVEFAERGQWDLESDTGERALAAPESYACFFENQSTVYNHDYQSWYTYDAPTGYDGVYDVAQIIDDQLDYVAYAAYWPKPIKHWVDDIGSLEDLEKYTTSSTVEQNFTGTGAAAAFVCNLHGGPVKYPRSETLGNWSEAPMVFVGTNHQILGSDYAYNSVNDTINFLSSHYPAVGANIRAFYKVGDGNADVPGDLEPCSPFTNAEWAFEMDAASDMFRVCTVFGVTDRNDADDTDRGLVSGFVQNSRTDVLDAEVKYYLNETFNPFDLYDAVHKQESRWLYLNSSLTSATSYITLTEGLDDTNYYNMTTGAWEPYGFDPERWYHADSVVDSRWVNEFENGTDYGYDVANSKNWALHLTGGGDSYEMMMITPKATRPTTAAPLTLQLKDLVDFGFWYRSLGVSPLGPFIEINVTNTANPATSTSYVTIQARSDNWISGANGHNDWHHYTLNTIEDFIHGYTSESAFQVADQHPDVYTPGQFHSFEYWTSKLANYYVHYVGVMVALESTALVDDVSIGYLDRTSGISYERVYNMEEDKLIPSDWDAYCSFAERVLINGTLIERYGYANRTAHESDYMIDFETGNITFYHWSLASGYHAWDLGIGTHVKVLYSTIEENEKGRYEWMVVGKDAAAIDSIGAAYMTEAFDSRKDIEVLLTGLDINDTANGPHAPFVMGGAATGTKADYRDSLGRPHLRDDWCTTYPVSSSNMLFSGGPRAQMGTEYFNEFTNAFFARSEYVVNDTGQADKIMALTCWNRTAFGAGYAVISVYKDLNGTIGFLIWGYDGQDTYYATQWFWSIPDGLEAPDGIMVYSGIEYLQHENRGVTDIILEIDYTTCPCSVSVTEERLGTISEKAQHDP